MDIDVFATPERKTFVKALDEIDITKPLRDGINNESTKDAALWMQLR